MAQSRHLLALLLLLSLSASILAHGGGSDDADADADEPGADHPDLRSKSLILTKIWCLIVVFFATFFGGVSPYFLKWNEVFLVLGTQFAGGVFLATAMIHFLSDSNETFGDLTHVDYPFAFMLACAGYALTLLADVAISFVVARGQTVRDVENHQGINLQQSKESSVDGVSHVRQENGHGAGNHSVPSLFRDASSLGDSILLIVALCFHSVFEGIAIGVAETKADAWRAVDDQPAQGVRGHRDGHRTAADAAQPPPSLLRSLLLRLRHLQPHRHRHWHHHRRHYAGPRRRLDLRHLHGLRLRRLCVRRHQPLVRQGVQTAVAGGVGHALRAVARGGAGNWSHRGRHDMGLSEDLFSLVFYIKRQSILLFKLKIKCPPCVKPIFI